MPEFEVVTPRPVRKLVDELAGKRAGYRAVYEQLGRDPCAAQLGAYRLLARSLRSSAESI